MRWLLATIATVVLTTGTASAVSENAYHGPDNKPRWLTTPCQLEDSNNCYWNAHAGGGSGHSFWAIPVGDNLIAVVYWNPAYNRDHGYVTTR